MTKSSKEQIKEDENKLLSELMKNSKENIDTIAKHCGFSRQKAWRLIKQLENSKKIWGYSAIVDSKKLGLEKFMLVVKRTRIAHDSKDINEVVANLMGSTKNELGINMISSYYIHGEYDWVMIFTADNIIKAKQFSDAIMQKFPGRQSNYLNQILYTVRENYIRNPDAMEMKDYM